jgi:hypothetical protein
MEVFIAEKTADVKIINDKTKIMPNRPPFILDISIIALL